MTRTRLSLYALAASVGSAVAAPVSADPTIGIGFSLSFGGGQPQLGAGVRVFSNDEEDELAASIGLDYVFTTQSVRPTIGAAYLMEDSYIGLDAGYNSTLGTFDFGAGAGFADTDDDSGRSGGNGTSENGNGENVLPPPELG
ncbi:hypothetical protein [Roseovarius sp. D22-M7]|uniref:hypothetical protein n=1 Tax=Roseovarius sp. D22-M7 TaxID=3127116 RepID=UPI00300FB343